MSRNNESNDGISVFVSRSSFCMVPSLYQKVEKLPWRKRGSDGCLCLNANADVFEMLLQFLMFKKLPETTGMTRKQARQLSRMIKPLDSVDALCDHVQIFLEGTIDGKTSASKFLQRLSSMTQNNPAQQDVSSSVSKIGTRSMTDNSFDHFSVSANGPITMDTVPTLEAADSADSSDASSSRMSESARTMPRHSVPSSYSSDVGEPFPLTSKDKRSSLSSPISRVRNVLQRMKRNDVSRTHAELCAASEFVS